MGTECTSNYNLWLLLIFQTLSHPGIITLEHMFETPEKVHKIACVCVCVCVSANGV